MSVDDATGRARVQQHASVSACLFASLGAACFGLAFPPIGIWPLAMFVVAPLTWAAIRGPSTRVIVLATLVTQFFMWLWLFRWLINVTPPGFPCLSLYMSVYPAIYAWIIRRMSRSARFSRLPMTMVVPIVWTGVEFLRGSVAFGGYPWYFLAHPIVGSVVMVQSADLLGSYFVTFLVAMTSGAMVDVALRVKLRDRSWWFVIRPAVVAMIILAANAGYGARRMAQRDSLSPGPAILAIQTNLPQSNKVSWSPEQQVEDFIKFCQLTVKAHEAAKARGERVDLIVWPETMLPGFGLEPDALKFVAEGGYSPGDAFARGIDMLRERLGTPILVGSPAYLGLRVENDEWVWDTQYNSAYLLQGKPPYQRYDKFALTPFGETMPYISNWKWLERKMLSFGARGMKFELSSNSDMKLFTLIAGGDRPEFIDSPLAPGSAGGSNDAPATNTSHATFVIGTPICFEDTVAPWCRRMVFDTSGGGAGGGTKRADVLVNLSNDGWFAQHDSERHLQAQIARFRCIENRVPMVRVVNTGTSMSIDSAGRVVERIGEGKYGTSRQSGSLLAKTQIDARRTLYGRIGEVWPWACLIVTMLGLLLTWRRAPQPAAI